MYNTPYEYNKKANITKQNTGKLNNVHIVWDTQRKFCNLMICSSLAAPQQITTYSAASDANFVKITSFSFSEYTVGNDFLWVCFSKCYEATSEVEGQFAE